MSRFLGTTSPKEISAPLPSPFLGAVSPPPTALQGSALAGVLPDCFLGPSASSSAAVGGAPSTSGAAPSASSALSSVPATSPQEQHHPATQSGTPKAIVLDGRGLTVASDSKAPPARLGRHAVDLNLHAPDTTNAPPNSTNIGPTKAGDGDQTTSPLSPLPLPLSLARGSADAEPAPLTRERTASFTLVAPEPGERGGNGKAVASLLPPRRHSGLRAAMGIPAHGASAESVSITYNAASTMSPSAPLSISETASAQDTPFDLMSTEVQGYHDGPYAAGGGGGGGGGGGRHRHDHSMDTVDAIVSTAMEAGVRTATAQHSHTATAAPSPPLGHGVGSQVNLHHELPRILSNVQQHSARANGETDVNAIVVPGASCPIDIELRSSSSEPVNRQSSEEALVPVLQQEQVPGDAERTTTGASPTTPPAPALASAAKPKVLLHRTADRQDDGVGNETVNDYTLWQELGNGTAGTVYAAIHNETGDMRALKAIPRKKVERVHAADKALLVEVAIMKKIRHPHVVALYECIDDPAADTVYLVMQYVPDGAIASLTKDGTCEPLSGERLHLFAHQILSALAQLHLQGIVHGDIKPDNILVDNNPSDMDHPAAYLSDFGVSRSFTYRCFGDLCVQEQIINNGAGTPLFFAPELFAGAPPSKATDVWAMGVTMYVLAYGELPFSSTNYSDLGEEVRTKTITFKPRKLEGEPDRLALDEEWGRLLERMLAKDPSERITAVEMVSMCAMCPCGMRHPITTSQQQASSQAGDMSNVATTSDASAATAGRTTSSTSLTSGASAGRSSLTGSLGSASAPIAVSEAEISAAIGSIRPVSKKNLQAGKGRPLVLDVLLEKLAVEESADRDRTIHVVEPSPPPSETHPAGRQHNNRSRGASTTTAPQDTGVLTAVMRAELEMEAAAASNLSGALGTPSEGAPPAPRASGRPTVSGGSGGGEDGIEGPMPTSATLSDPTAGTMIPRMSLIFSGDNSINAVPLQASQLRDANGSSSGNADLTSLAPPPGPPGLDLARPLAIDPAVTDSLGLDTAQSTNSMPIGDTANTQHTVSSQQSQGGVGGVQSLGILPLHPTSTLTDGTLGGSGRTGSLHPGGQLTPRARSIGGGLTPRSRSLAGGHTPRTRSLGHQAVIDVSSVVVQHNGETLVGRVVEGADHETHIVLDSVTEGFLAPEQHRAMAGSGSAFGSSMGNDSDGGGGPYASSAMMPAGFDPFRGNSLSLKLDDGAEEPQAPLRDPSVSSLDGSRFANGGRNASVFASAAREGSTSGTQSRNRSGAATPATNTSSRATNTGTSPAAGVILGDILSDRDHRGGSRRGPSGGRSPIPREHLANYPMQLDDSDADSLIGLGPERGAAVKARDDDADVLPDFTFDGVDDDDGSSDRASSRRGALSPSDSAALGRRRSSTEPYPPHQAHAKSASSRARPIVAATAAAAAGVPVAIVNPTELPGFDPTVPHPKETSPQAFRADILSLSASDIDFTVAGGDDARIKNALKDEANDNDSQSSTRQRRGSDVRPTPVPQWPKETSSETGTNKLTSEAKVNRGDEADLSPCPSPPRPPKGSAGGGGAGPAVTGASLRGRRFSNASAASLASSPSRSPSTSSSPLRHSPHAPQSPPPPGGGSPGRVPMIGLESIAVPTNASAHGRPPMPPSSSRPTATVGEGGADAPMVQASSLSLRRDPSLVLEVPATPTADPPAFSARRPPRRPSQPRDDDDDDDSSPRQPNSRRLSTTAQRASPMIAGDSPASVQSPATGLVYRSSIDGGMPGHGNGSETGDLGCPRDGTDKDASPNSMIYTPSTDSTVARRGYVGRHLRHSFSVVLTPSTPIVGGGAASTQSTPAPWATTPNGGLKDASRALKTPHSAAGKPSFNGASPPTTSPETSASCSRNSSFHTSPQPPPVVEGQPNSTSAETQKSSSTSAMSQPKPHLPPEPFSVSRSPRSRSAGSTPSSGRPSPAHASVSPPSGPTPPTSSNACPSRGGSGSRANNENEGRGDGKGQRGASALLPGDIYPDMCSVPSPGASITHYSPDGRHSYQPSPPPLTTDEDATKSPPHYRRSAHGSRSNSAALPDDDDADVDHHSHHHRHHRHHHCHRASHSTLEPCEKPRNDSLTDNPTLTTRPRRPEVNGSGCCDDAGQGYEGQGQLHGEQHDEYGGALGDSSASPRSFSPSQSGGVGARQMSQIAMHGSDVGEESPVPLPLPLESGIVDTSFMRSASLGRLAPRPPSVASCDAHSPRPPSLAESLGGYDMGTSGSPRWAGMVPHRDSRQATPTSRSQSMGSAGASLAVESVLEDGLGISGLGGMVPALPPSPSAHSQRSVRSDFAQGPAARALRRQRPE